MKKAIYSLGFDMWLRTAEQLMKKEIGMDLGEYHYLRELPFSRPVWKLAHQEGKSEKQAVQDLVGNIWSKEWKAYLSAELHGV